MTTEENYKDYEILKVAYEHVKTWQLDEIYERELNDTSMYVVDTSGDLGDDLLPEWMLPMMKKARENGVVYLMFF